MQMAQRHLLLVCHKPSPNLGRLAESALRSASEAVEGVDSVNISLREPQLVTPDQVLAADALLFGTCENLATMAGLSKDFFDRCYYPVLEEKQGMPFACYIRAGQDGTGTSRQLQSITTGLRWRWVAEPLVLKGAWQDAFVDQVEELAAGMAMGLEQGIF